MAIVSLADIKKHMKSSSTTYDTFITNQIEAVFEYIVDYTSNIFQDYRTNVCGQFTISNNDSDIGTITNSDVKFIDTYNYAVGDKISIFRSFQNDGIYTISELTETTITVDVELEEENQDSYAITIYKVNVPKPIVKIMADMMNYDIARNFGVQSESLSRHSVTYNQDYPPEILRRLNKYRKIGW